MKVSVHFYRFLTYGLAQATGGYLNVGKLKPPPTGSPNCSN